MTESKGLSPEPTYRETLLGEALANILVAAGVFGAEHPGFTGPELLMGAEGYVKALASRSTSKPVGVEDEDLASVAGLPSSQEGSDPQGEHSAGGAG